MNLLKDFRRRFQNGGELPALCKILWNYRFFGISDPGFGPTLLNGIKLEVISTSGIRA